MNAMADPAAPFLARLDAVEQRLAEQAGATFMGLTAPDSKSGERWEAGQIWAHLAEFIPYWVTQAERLIADNAHQPQPFGRTKSNSERLAAIERERGSSSAQLWQNIREDISDLRGFLSEMPDYGWRIRGRHETRGVMAMPAIIEEFLVGHLEEHAAQLDTLSPTPR